MFDVSENKWCSVGYVVVDVNVMGEDIRETNSEYKLWLQAVPGVVFSVDGSAAN